VRGFLWQFSPQSEIMASMKPKHHATIRFLKSGLFDNINSFSELERRISDLDVTETERGDAFEVFTEALFATQKKYQAKNVWPDKSIPPQIAKKLLLPSKDMGVDGVFEDLSGNLTAYQVKFRSYRPVLLWGELGTFFGLSEKADHRMVITNCDDLADVAKHRPNFSSVRGNTLDHLDTRDFQAIRSWLSSGEVKRKKKTPWPYQKEAIRDIRKQLAKTDRTTAVMACGSGKTLVSLWVAEAVEPKNVLVLLPSLALVDQIFNDWASETKWENVAYMCVCSDKSGSD
jgi:predicted helicase